MLSLVLLATAAHADVPLLHDGDTHDAVELAVAQGAGPAWELDPLRAAQLLPSDRPGLVGVDSACHRAPTSAAELRTTVTVALARIQRRTWEAAATDLAVARAMLACLAEEADAERAAQVYLMTGVLAVQAERPGDAVVAFDRAARFGPQVDGRPVLSWDSRIASPTMGEELLTAATEALHAAPLGSLRLAPGVDPGVVSVRIDGHTTPVPATGAIDLSAGYHLVQVVAAAGGARTVRTYEVDLQAGQTIVVADPQGLSDLPLATHAGTEAMTDLLHAAGVPSPTWMVAHGEAWKRVDTTWTHLPALDLHQQRQLSERHAFMRHLGWGALGTGVAVAAAGAAFAMPISTPQGWEEVDEHDEFRVQQARRWWGLAAFGGGLAVCGGSLVVYAGRAEAPPTSAPR